MHGPAVTTITYVTSRIPPNFAFTFTTTIIPKMDVKAAKRRKLTDKSLPTAILQNPDFAEDSKMYQSLLDMERKLDWVMTRKKVEVQDSFGRGVSTNRTLRLFLSHTVSGQAWQPQEDNSTGETNVPAWQLKIEGRVLELPNQRSKDKGPPRKFSTLVKRLVVELDRDPKLYPESNIVEWPRATGSHNPVMDGFTVRRTGDTPTNIRIVLYLDHYPEQFKVSPELGELLGIKEESRLGTLQALWNYIKINGLQDKNDKRVVHANDPLRQLFGGHDTVPFVKLPEFVARFLMPPEPILLHYTLDPSLPPPDRPTAWDVEVKIQENPSASRTAIQPSKELLTQLTQIDDNLSTMAQSLHNSHLKRTFLQSFARDPAQFVSAWVESQSRDLEVVVGSGPSEGMTVRREELRRGEFFRMGWVEEAVAVQEGLRLAARGVGGQ
ncbi:SWI/SNF and RSC complex subunit Ssr3 [Marasmius crinis-equi]|uniref:SWI/SNF and RSC complex subunit Ssr3 n=1 Tax=Marasmius crinis-equi TaxID=585013 RepID=A0ABR3F8M9_9AGAR